MLSISPDDERPPTKGTARLGFSVVRERTILATVVGGNPSDVVNSSTVTRRQHALLTSCFSPLRRHAPRTRHNRHNNNIIMSRVICRPPQRERERERERHTVFKRIFDRFRQNTARPLIGPAEPFRRLRLLLDLIVSAVGASRYSIIIYSYCTLLSLLSIVVRARNRRA